MSASDHLSDDEFGEHKKVHSFDVTVSTHDDLKDGVIAKKVHGSQHAHHRIVVAHDDPVTAQLIAAQMAHVTSGYVTGAYHRI